MKLLVLFALLHVAVGVNFYFVNNDSKDIWVGCQGNPGHENLNNGGWVLTSGEFTSLSAPENWSGRIWGRTWCDPKTQHCLTGDCSNKLECNGNDGAPPASVAEIALRSGFYEDHYGISLVDGFNIEISIAPLGGQGDGSEYSCTKAACNHNILADCPTELQLNNNNGQVVGCNSACSAFDTDEYCCRGAHNTPETCKSTNWPVNYQKFFKDRCPNAQSYAYDDQKITFTAYRITFGAS